MKILLCGIAKLENNYIKEWVEWYKNLGVDHICLYDNNDPDGERFEDVISDYIDSGFVEIINYRGKTVCLKEAYNDCYSKYKNEYDWFLFLDIDELLEVFDSTLKSFLSLKKFKPYVGIKIYWRCFDDNGLIKVENNDYSMYNRFKIPYTKHSNFTMQSKTIIRGGLNVKYYSNVHYPDNIGFICNTLGKWVYPSIVSKKILWKYAVINHYRCKTIEEYIRNKMSRLYPDLSKESASLILTLDKFFKINERTPEKEEYAKLLMEEYGHTICSR